MAPSAFKMVDGPKMVTARFRKIGCETTQTYPWIPHAVLRRLSEKHVKRPKTAISGAIKDSVRGETGCDPRTWSVTPRDIVISLWLEALLADNETKRSAFRDESGHPAMHFQSHHPRREFLQPLSTTIGCPSGRFSRVLGNAWGSLKAARVK